jgi:hypothetical protein
MVASAGRLMKTRFVFLLVALATACSSTPENKKGGEAASPEGPKALEHEKCDASIGRVQVLDADHKGKPVLTQVFDKTTGRELCRVSDLNHDGKPDMWEYYNADGTLRRREGAYDSTDAVSEVQYYQDGKLVRRERDTNGQRKIDTWDTYDPNTGKLVKRERDTNGDGKVDQWWTWDGDKITINVDKNGDGKPDPDQTIVVGPNGQAISPAATASNTGADAGAGVAPPPPITPPVIMPNGPALDAKHGHGKKKPGAKKKK